MLDSHDITRRGPRLQKCGTADLVMGFIARVYIVDGLFFTGEQMTVVNKSSLSFLPIDIILLRSRSSINSDLSVYFFSEISLLLLSLLDCFSSFEWKYLAF